MTTDALKILDKKLPLNAEEWTQIEEGMEKDKIAMQIYTLRREKGLTQQQLAEKAGTTQSRISKIENDDFEGYTLSFLKRIAQAMDCQVDVTIRQPRTCAQAGAAAARKRSSQDPKYRFYRTQSRRKKVAVGSEYE